MGTWTYRDHSGEPLMVVARFLKPPDPAKPGKKPPKTFRPVWRDGDVWRIGDPPGKLPLYNIPGLRAAKPHEPIFVVEGEKKADLLISMGLVATTSAHGCRAADKSDWSPVAGHDIVVMPDHDPEGDEYAAAVSAQAEELDVPDLRVIKLATLVPNMPKGGDVVDLIQAFGGDTAKARAEILALVERTEPATLGFAFRPVSAVDLVHEYPSLRPVVIDGLLRQGEVMNVVAGPKVGKSWLIMAMAIAVVTGRKWLGWGTSKGDVLLIDAELHRETLARRIDATRRCLGVQEEDVRGLDVVSLRGERADIDTLARRLGKVPYGKYRIIVLDALYRFMPLDGEENSNESMTRVYNTLDQIAKATGAAIGVVHHASKGSQSEKSVTDVGSGAGAQSRAPDTHLVLRPHEEEGAVVVDAAVRSFPPSDAFVIRATNPGWVLAPDLDPSKLRKNKRNSRSTQSVETDDSVPTVEWNPEKFARDVVGAAMLIRDDVLANAKSQKLSKATAESLLRRAEEAKLVHRYIDEVTGRNRFSTTPPLMLLPGEGEVGAALTPGALAPGGCGGDALPPSPPPPTQRRRRPFEDEHEANGL